jgi:hypothetical protein
MAKIDYKLGKNDIHRLVNYATKVPSKAKEIQKETRKHITTAITAAFAFVIALTWRDAIRGTIDSLIVKLGVPETVYFYEFIVALLVTFICVLGIMFVSRYSVKKEEKKK